MGAEKQFLTSVADAYLFDTDNDTLVLKGKTLLNSSIEQAVENQEIRGGKGSQLQLDYNYAKTLNISIEESQVLEDYIALQNNQPIANELRDYYIEENVTLSSGTGTLSNTPINNVYVTMPNGNNITITPTGDSIDLSSNGLTNETVKVVYRYETSADHIVINADEFPKSYKLVLNADFRTKSGKTAEMQLTVPKYKIDGNFTLDLSHDGVSSFTINGKALADDNNNYAHIDVIPVNGTSKELAAIAATPTEVELSASNASDEQQLTVYGIYGGSYANTIVTDDCTFTSDDTSVAKVDANGLITHADTPATSGSSTVIRVTNGSLVDTVQVDIIA